MLDKIGEFSSLGLADRLMGTVDRELQGAAPGRAIASKSLTTANLTAKTQRTQSSWKKTDAKLNLYAPFDQILYFFWLFPLFSLRSLRLCGSKDYMQLP